MALEIAGNGQTYFHLNPCDAFPTTSELQLTAYNIAISELSYSIYMGIGEPEAAAGGFIDLCGGVVEVWSVFVP